MVLDYTSDAARLGCFYWIHPAEGPFSIPASQAAAAPPLMAARWNLLPHHHVHASRWFQFEHDKYIGATLFTDLYGS